MRTQARVERRLILPAGRWDVWAALTRPAELSRWFGAEILSVELRPGGRIVARDAAGRVHRAVVETVEAPARFAFRWLPAAVGPGRAPAEFSPGAVVEFLVEETGEGTVLTVVETPWSESVQAVLAEGPVFMAGGLPDPAGAPPRIQALA